MIKQDNQNTVQPQLLNVQQAASYLGVHAGTVRRWAYANKLKGSKIGIRGDWRFTEADLLKLAIPGEISDISSTVPKSASSPISDWSISGENAHFVQFYEDDAFLVKIIKEFINSGDSAIVVVTPEHKKTLEEGLELYGLDLSVAQEIGAYVCLDAQETLSRFLVDGLPDPDLFFEVVGGIITKASREKKKLRIFGEMVAILWSEGNHEAAVMLEELWNDLQKIHSFSLFCAYPINKFGEKKHSAHFERIGSTHSHVLPSEKYSTIPEDDARLREIALLQQKAQALEAEITHHKNTEDKLLNTVIKLKDMEQRREDFLSAASHELKTPLTSQKVFIQLLQREAVKNKEEKYFRYLTKVHEQTEKLTKLVNDLLDVSKVHGGQLALHVAEFDINKCIRECIEEIQAITTKHKIYIKGKNLGKISADKDKISQVIVNLLTNAVKYSPKGKSIYVEKKMTKNNIVISVKDYGIGIDKKNQDMVFERFYRVNDNNEKTYPGLGMGLYIANEIVKQHKGNIAVKSVKGKGSVFSFSIPLK